MARLPSTFCWTKFGTEAGESTTSILERKEAERRGNGGIFLWGIGTSIRPSLAGLIATDPSPKILFTPMLSAPSPRDVRPAVVGAWSRARDTAGRPWPMPEHTCVTSGRGDSGRLRNHYALVCRGSAPIKPEPDENSWLDDDLLRNLRTGTRVGSSQVTSVVRRIDNDASSRPRYRVTYRAELVAPYLVVLEGWSQINPSVRAEDELRAS